MVVYSNSVVILEFLEIKIHEIITLSLITVYMDSIPGNQDPMLKQIFDRLDDISNRVEILEIEVKELSDLYYELVDYEGEEEEEEPENDGYEDEESEDDGSIDARPDLTELCTIEEALQIILQKLENFGGDNNADNPSINSKLELLDSGISEMYARQQKMYKILLSMNGLTDLEEKFE